jgi:Asp-tRNA(Asn)/Glu-tRNA(Gln) amidotransferase A subunit family amidase
MRHRGFESTFGLVSLKGVFPIEPKHLDTVGPIGKDIAHVVQGMDLLQNGFEVCNRRPVSWTEVNEENLNRRTRRKQREEI